MQGVRERVLRIGRAGQAVKDGEEVGVDVCARWLIGTFFVLPHYPNTYLVRYDIAQLKVNLRPLWSPATEAISTLSQRFPEVVWAYLFEDLKKASLREEGNKAPGWATQEDQAEDEDDPHEEERTWRDGAAHKVRAAVHFWTPEGRTRARVVQVSKILLCL
jgi:U3 small nucleolar RNA-associated protein 20